MPSLLERLLIAEVSGVGSPAHMAPGWMIAKSREQDPGPADLDQDDPVAVAAWCLETVDAELVKHGAKEHDREFVATALIITYAGLPD